ncbi:aldo/keto reductase [Thalassotalea fusca]
MHSNSIVFIQARTNSSRLPGKVLMPIMGIPIVVLCARRAMSTGKDVMVVTSQEGSDDELCRVLDIEGIKYFRGDLDNTLKRVNDALVSYDDEVNVIRLTADNVIPDGSLLDEFENAFINNNLDYMACGGKGSGLPYGVSAEITKLRLIREAHQNATTDFEREHVTPYIIKKCGRSYFEFYSELNAESLRCTIDCLDDYLNICELFSQFKKAPSISWLDLVSALKGKTQSSAYLAKKKEIILGGAQLGMHYGITNIKGKPSKTDAVAIVKKAVEGGITTIDTARAYTGSEKLIGYVNSQGWEGRFRIITKLSPFNNVDWMKKSRQDIQAYVESSLFQSLCKLRTNSVDVLMLHRAEHIDTCKGQLLKILENYKELGIVKSIGVSVQSPQELDAALSYEGISYIQLPFNILDTRWFALKERIFAIKKVRELNIHVRSIYLQGLLLSTEGELWTKANCASPESIISWFDLLKGRFRCTKKELLWSYINTQKWVDGIVVGAESESHVSENVELSARQGFSAEDLKFINETRPNVSVNTLNPAYWN